MKMEKKVVIGSRARSCSSETIALLKRRGCELLMNPYDRTLTEPELIEMIQGADALIAGSDKVNARVLESGAPTLKIVARQGVGYDSVDIEAAKRLGIAVTNTPGANSKSVADLAFGLLLATARNIPAMDRAIRTKGWYRHTGCEVDGKTIGIVGMGNIGGQVAKRARGFGMKVLAYDVYPRQDFIDNYDVTYVALDELFREADFVSLHAPVTEKTRNMVDADKLRTMKSTAFLINTARGDLVDENALYEALKTGVIAGAAIDVYRVEPPTDSPLSELPNLVLTAHAGAYTNEAIVNAGVIAAEEIIRVLSGGSPLYNVAK